VGVRVVWRWLRGEGGAEEGDAAVSESERARHTKEKVNGTNLS